MSRNHKTLFDRIKISVVDKQSGDSISTRNFANSKSLRQQIEVKSCSLKDNDKYRPIDNLIKDCKVLGGQLI
mgnify:CR=1 FL=1